MFDNNIEGTRQIDSVTSGQRGTAICGWHRIGESDCLIKTQDSAKYLMMYWV